MGIQDVYEIKDGDKLPLLRGTHLFIILYHPQHLVLANSSAAAANPTYKLTHKSRQYGQTENLGARHHLSESGSHKRHNENDHSGNALPI